MAIAMRLRNQLQSVYKLDPLRNEVGARVLRARMRRVGDVRGFEERQRPAKAAHLAGDRCRLRGADGEERESKAEALRREPRLSMRALWGSTRVVLFNRGAACGNPANLLSFCSLLATRSGVFASSARSLLVRAMRE